ncbi:MAG TPA: translation initiation factor IF-3 [Thermoleophilaceae bacterium]
MPIPRRFDRRPPERDQTRINERIRVPQVRLIGDDGNQIGVIPTDQALKYAQERDLDLVEVAAEARPPVVRALDYSKYKYEQEQKAKAARRHQKQVTVREIKLRPKIANNDYETKKGHVVRFLKHADRVKITIMFRGRETTHPERGEALLMRLAEDVGELGIIEQRPNLDGRNMTMVLAPARAEEEGGGGGHHQETTEPRPAKRERREVRLRREAAEAAGGEGDAHEGEDDVAEGEDEAVEAAAAGDAPQGGDAQPDDAPGGGDAQPDADAQPNGDPQPDADAQPGATSAPESAA